MKRTPAMSQLPRTAPAGQAFALAITVTGLDKPITTILTHAGSFQVRADAEQKASRFPPGAGVSVVLVPARSQ